MKPISNCIFCNKPYKSTGALNNHIIKNHGKPSCNPSELTSKRSQTDNQLNNFTPTIPKRKKGKTPKEESSKHKLDCNCGKAFIYHACYANHISKCVDYNNISKNNFFFTTQNTTTIILTQILIKLTSIIV